MDEYNAAFLGFGTTTDAAPVTDERASSMQEYYDDGAFYQGLSRSIPLTIPIDNYIQTMATGGDIPDTLAAIDADWAGSRCAADPLIEIRHDHSHRPPRHPPACWSTRPSTAASTTSRAPPTTSGTPRVDPIYYWFLIPTLALFTLAITVPAVLGIFYSFTELHRVRRVAVHRAHQLHRRVLRPGDPRRLLVRSASPSSRCCS